MHGRRGVVPAAALPRRRARVPLWGPQLAPLLHHPLLPPDRVRDLRVQAPRRPREGRVATDRARQGRVRRAVGKAHGEQGFERGPRGAGAVGGSHVGRAVRRAGAAAQPAAAGPVGRHKEAHVLVPVDAAADARPRRAARGGAHVPGEGRERHRQGLIVGQLPPPEQQGALGLAPPGGRREPEPARHGDHDVSGRLGAPPPHAAEGRLCPARTRPRLPPLHDDQGDSRPAEPRLFARPALPPGLGRIPDAPRLHPQVGLQIQRDAPVPPARRLRRLPAGRRVAGGGQGLRRHV
mmetsp:Transcript_25688/g.64758  ORF Transcript_25688/g.64758 Transcript_25688/m.64758 type:complete len:293 (-) Transcript_25688:537-1415(-)